MVIINTLLFYVFSIFTLSFLIFIILKAKKISDVKFNKIEIAIIIITIAISTLIYGILIFTRKYIYIWDTSIYYLNQLHLLEKFDISFWQGIKSIITTTYREDYGNFLLSFTSGIFSLTNRTENAFVMTYFIVGTVPIIIIFAMIIKKIINLNLKESSNKWTILSFIPSILLIILFPLLHKSAIFGQPDLMGLIFIGLIILLTIDYDFSIKDYKRWFYIIGCTFCAMITRRWYIFWVFGYYLTYALLVIIKALIKYKNEKNESKLAKENLKTTMKIILKFAITSAIILGILISPIIYRTIANNYQSSYSAWLDGGFFGEVKSQFGKIGIWYFALMLAGIVFGIINKRTRMLTMQMSFTWILSLLAFTRIQNMGDHQSLILVPTYLILTILGINALITIPLEKIKDKIGIAWINIFALVIVETIILSIIILNFVGSITYNKYIYNNKFFTSTDLKAIDREDIENIKKMTNFILQNCETTDKVYINAASGNYNNTTFTNVILPDHIELDAMLPYSLSIDSVHGFPVDIVKSKYVFTTNITVDDNTAENGNIIPIVNYAIMQDEVISKNFEKVEEFKMNDAVTFYAYKRIEKFNETEREEWLELFEDLSEKYTGLYAEKIMALED